MWMVEEIVFYEKQKLYKHTLVLTMVIGVNLLFLWGCIQQIGRGIPWGNNPLSNLGLLVVSLCMFLLFLSLFFIQLKTIINKEGIYIEYFPLLLKYKFSPWSDIENAYVRRYSPIREYGGWGKRSLFANKVYNVYGNMGIQITFNNGDQLLIGTNRPCELSEVLNKLNDKRKQK